MNLRRREALAGALFVSPAMAYFLVVFYRPMAESIALAFSVKTSAGDQVGLGNFTTVLADSTFWDSIRITVTYAALAVPMTLVPALAFAVLLHEVAARNLVVRGALLTTYLLPITTSLVAAAMIWGWILNPGFGIANAALGAVGIPSLDWLRSTETVLPSLAIIHVWLRVGFATLLLLAGLQQIPDELQDAASIDGASPFQRFRSITLPLLNPQITLVLIIELIFAVKVFDQVFVATDGGPARSSNVVMLYIYETAFRWNRPGEASVAAILVCAALLAVSLIQWRFLRRAVSY